MAINKFTVLLPLAIMILGASAVPVSNPADVHHGKVPGPSPQRRGYDGDWLYSRGSVKPGESSGPSHEQIVAGKTVIVNGESQVVQKRGYDGDWLYSRQSAELAEEPAVDAQI